MLNIPGYMLTRLDRDFKNGGGIAVYTKNYISLKVNRDLSAPSSGDGEIEQLWLECKFSKACPLLLGCIYRPPESTSDQFEKLYLNVEHAVINYKNIAIIGDLNCDLLRADYSHTKLLIRLFETHHLTQLIKQPTRITNNSGTLIDVIAVNNESLVVDSGSLESNISNHSIVYCIIKKKIKKPKVCNKEFRSLKHFEARAFQNYLQSVPWDAKKRNGCNKWKCLYLEVLNKHAPIKRIKIRQKGKPWFTSDLHAMIIQRDKIFKKASKSTNEKEKKNLWEGYLAMRNKIKISVKQAKAEYYNRLIKEKKQCPRELWRIIRQVFPSSKHSSNFSECDNTKACAENFNKYFTNIGEKIQSELGSVGNEFNFPFNVTSRFKLNQVAQSEVVQIISSLSSDKATGIDTIDIRTLKIAVGRRSFRTGIHHLFN
jgi:hypothetical protein